MRGRPVRRLSAAAAALLVLTSACASGNSATPEARPTTTEASEEHPPVRFVELQRTFDPILEPLGVRMTRGSLIAVADGSYETSATGDHLALYVEPIDSADYRTSDYVENLYELAALLTPLVFERWSGLESYDVCQEAPDATGNGDDENEVPATVLDITREAAAAFDWEAGDLATLLAAAAAHEEITLEVGRVVEAAPAYRAALDQAGLGTS